MRLFTLVMSTVLAAGGAWMIVSSHSSGWLVAGFFGLCLLVAIFEPWFPKPQVSCEYQLVITRDEIAWEDVNRIWYVTTSDGPWLPDQWILLEGENGGCSFPTEALGFDGIWDELKRRFAVSITNR
jgi:hypothetical protein